MIGRLTGQFDFVERVKIEVFLWRDEGTVWAIKTGGDEERLVAILFQQLDRFGGDFAVSLLFVGTFRREQRERTAQRTLWRQSMQQMLFVLIATARINDLVPRWRVIQPTRADLAWHAIVINLADARGVIPVV